MKKIKKNCKKLGKIAKNWTFFEENGTFLDFFRLFLKDSLRNAYICGAYTGSMWGIYRRYTGSLVGTATRPLGTSTNRLVYGSLVNQPNSDQCDHSQCDHSVNLFETN